MFINLPASRFALSLLAWRRGYLFCLDASACREGVQSPFGFSRLCRVSRLSREL